MTFTSVYFKTDLELSTIPDYQGPFFLPQSANDWRTASIDLEEYLGENVQIRFVNITGQGSSTFIDNINLSQVLNTANFVQTEILMFPNPAENFVQFDFGNTTTVTNITIVNSLDQTILTTSDSVISSEYTLDVSTLNTGMYFVLITADGKKQTRKILVN